MTPIAIAILLGAAVIAGALTALFIVRFRRARQLKSNIVDLAAARRRKLRELSVNATKTTKEPSKPKPLSPTGAEIRGFIPKNGDARLQSCTRCQKKSDSVGFYVDEYGNLVGVCRECRKSAKNRDLMPL